MGGKGEDSAADISCAADTSANSRSVASDALPPITQENLPEALKNGLITQSEVDDVWRQTEFLSAQTPIEVRRAVIALKKDGNEVRPVEQVLLQVMMDLRASLFRDESKFAHLVAGTETIVDKLQSINKWEALVENLSNKVDELMFTINGMLGERRAEKGAAPSDEPDPDDPYGPGAKPINFDDEETDIDRARRLDNEEDEQYERQHGVAEPEPEEPYDRKIGSNWTPDNPRKK